MAIALGGTKLSAGINVTPLIDVVMVLLIIFMVLPSKTVGLDSELPQPAPDNAPAIPNPQNLVLSIHKDGSIDINTQAIAFDQLGARLKTLFAGRPDGVLFINGSRELHFADVATVIDIARGVGVDRVGILTDRDMEDK